MQSASFSLYNKAMMGQRQNIMTDFRVLPLHLLVDYIVDVHHGFILRQAPKINHLIKIASEKHFKTHPDLEQVKFLFRIMAHDLTKHMCKEEHILFPYIKNLVQLDDEKLEFKLPPFKTVQNPITTMQREHEAVNKYNDKIAELTNNFKAKPNDPIEIKELMGELNEFNYDLKIHVQLEDEILFTRAIELENKFIQKTS